MSIRSTALMALPFLAAGCALNPNPEIGPEPNQPLEAHVFSDGGGNLVFSTSHRAYVAVFEIAPYDGVGLLYPQIGGQEASAVNVGWILPGFRTYRWAYLSQTGGSLLASMYLGPRYIFMIASDEPLNVSDLVARPFALREAMGYTAFQGRRPYETMDRLAAMAIRDPDHTRWATDVYMIWPTLRPPPERYILVDCNGQLLRIPYAYALYVARSCAGTATNVIATAAPRHSSGDTVNAIAKVEHRHRGKEPIPSASDPGVAPRSVDRYLMGREGLADGRRDPRELRHGVPIEPTTPGRFTGVDGRGSSSFEERRRALDDHRGVGFPAYDGRTESGRLTRSTDTRTRGNPSASSSRSSRPVRPSTGTERSSPTHAAPAPRPSATSTRSAPSHAAPPASSSTSGSSHSHGHGHVH